jgi:predicted phosphohydrolase
MDKIDKLNIADEMLDGAIDEFLNKERYMVSINLAAVAEELYGKYIRVLGGHDVQMETIAAVMKANPDSSLIVNEWKGIANKLKNGIKHFDSESKRYMTFEPQVEARLMIADAISNSEKLARPNSKLIELFYEYARNLGLQNAQLS